MTMENWYVRRGRTSRSVFLVQYLLPILLAGYLAGKADSALGLLGGPLEYIVGLGTAVPLVAATVTRLHDFGASAWRLLFLPVLLIPFLGLFGLLALPLLLVALVFSPGDEVANRYGPPPASSRPSWLPAALRRQRSSAHDIDIEVRRPLQAESR